MPAICGILRAVMLVLGPCTEINYRYLALCLAMRIRWLALALDLWPWYLLTTLAKRKSPIISRHCSLLHVRCKHCVNVR